MNYTHVNIEIINNRLYMGSPKIKQFVTNETCSFGCGSPATVEFMNGKFCCSTSFNSCLAMKRINSLKQVGNSYKTGHTNRSWSKGLTKDVDPRLERHHFKGVKFGSALTGHSKETREKISKSKSKSLVKVNRYTPSKRTLHNGILLESSWELKLALDLDANNIEYVQPKPFIWIDDENQTRRYYPDFYLPQHDIYLDPKNPYLQKLDARKFELVRIQHNIKLYMLNQNQLSWSYIKTLIA